MTKKIFNSIFTVSLVVLLASISIATTFLYGYFNDSQVKQLKAELSLVSETVNDVGIEYFESFDSTVFRFTVVDADGTVLYDTQADTSTMENHADREEIAEAFKSGAGSSERSSATLTQKTFYEAVLLENGDVLRISISRLTLGSLIMIMLPAILAIVLTSAVMAAILSHAMATKVTEPLMSLNLDDPSHTPEYEELNPIITRLHRQHKQIKTQMEALRRKTDELEHIICLYVKTAI